jgi:enterochelin esterase-like enzyme
MNEATLEKTRDFPHVRAMLDDVISVLLPYVEERFRPSQLAAE